MFELLKRALKPGAEKLAGPIPHPPAKFIDIVGGGDFDAIGSEFLGLFRNHGGLKPSDDVLDIGSGCGRMAIPLTQYLSPSAAYRGIDIIAPMVDWCSREITSRHPNFQFQHANLKNTLYSDKGSSAAGYRFPFQDRAFDFVFATSVFTHLMPDSAGQYLREARRVLRPGGHAVFTWFLVAPDYHPSTAPGRIAFGPISGPCRFANAEIPEAATAYDHDYAVAACEEAGLSVEIISRGHWNDGGGYSFQDVMILNAT